MSVKQYAAASDYVRLYALYNYGGIYLDSDIEVFKSLDTFLNNTFFTGLDLNICNEVPQASIEAGIMGSVKGFDYLLECMKYYETHHFIHADGSYDNAKTLAPEVYTM